MQQKEYYRPIWTCGRYNEKAQVAIFYNLIAGMSYYFEEFSAMVIGEVLKVQRNGKFCLENISAKLGIAMESLSSFFVELEKLGIVSSVFPSDDVIDDYRKRTSEHNRLVAMTKKETTKEMLPYETTNAEKLYTDKVNGITSVMLELTYNCSEKCIHCYNEGATRNDEEKSKRGDREELKLEDYVKLIDELYGQGLFKVCLTGGDPFSNPLAWKIIKYLYDKDIAFDVFTNGQRIIGDVKRLADFYPRLVGVSIYSGIAEVHDYVTRVKGSWERSMSVIEQLSAFGVPLNLKCCVMRPNVKSYYMVADIAKQYGAVPQFEVCLTDSVDGDQCVSKYLRMTPEQYEIVLRDDNIKLYVGEEAPNYGGMTRNMDDNACGAGDNSLCITPEGNVIPCCSFHTVFGNVKDQSILTIIADSEELAYWRSRTLRNYEECGRYDYCAYCNLCPGVNFSETGSPLKAASGNCYIAKVRCDLANKMKSGYDPLQGKTLRQRLAELPDYTSVRIKREKSQDFSDTKLTVGG